MVSYFDELLGISVGWFGEIDDVDLSGQIRCGSVPGLYSV